MRSSSSALWLAVSIVCERGSALARVAVEQVGCDARLHVDRGQCVRDDVVQVTGDPQPLLLGPSLRLLLAASLGQLDPLEQNPNV